MTPSRSRAASPKLTIGLKEVFDHSTCIAPLAAQRIPHRVIPSLPANLPKHAIGEDDEEEGESSGADTITRPNQHGDKLTTSSKTEFDWDPNLHRRRPKSTSAMQIPTERCPALCHSHRGSDPLTRFARGCGNGRWLMALDLTLTGNETKIGGLPLTVYEFARLNVQKKQRVMAV